MIWRPQASSRLTSLSFTCTHACTPIIAHVSWQQDELGYGCRAPFPSLVSAGGGNTRDVFTLLSAHSRMENELHLSPSEPFLMHLITWKKIQEVSSAATWSSLNIMMPVLSCTFLHCWMIFHRLLKLSGL